MEAINNLANTASKAIWGEQQTEEPVSGIKGDTSKGEPFDAGNKGEEQDALNEGRDTTDTTTTTTSHAPSAPSTTDRIPGIGSDGTADNRSTGAAGTTNTTTTTTGGGGAAASSIPATNPAETKDSSLATGDSTKAQNDVRDPSDPKTDADKADAKRNVDNSDQQSSLSDQEKLKGPGPKPIDEVARQHGGDAGKVSAKGEGAPKPLGGNDDDGDDDDDGPQKVSHGEGTGEKYVKSSGLKADGGDFDASTAGAGREADRLLVEKGVHVGGDSHAGAGLDQGEETKGSGGSHGHSHGHGHGIAHHGPSLGHSTSPEKTTATETAKDTTKETKETKEKKSLSEKIKAKLHKN